MIYASRTHTPICAGETIITYRARSGGLPLERDDKYRLYLLSILKQKKEGEFILSLRFILQHDEYAVRYNEPRNAIGTHGAWPRYNSARVLARVPFE